jgi:hypothetical protein
MYICGLTGSRPQRNISHRNSSSINFNQNGERSKQRWKVRNGILLTQHEGGCFLMSRNARACASSMVNSKPKQHTHTQDSHVVIVPHRRAPPQPLLLPFLRLPSPSDSCSCSSRGSSSRDSSSWFSRSSFNFPSR